MRKDGGIPGLGGYPSQLMSPVTQDGNWGACNLEKQNGEHLTGERKEGQEREEERLLFSSSSACILGPVLSQLGPRLWLPAS